MNSFALCKCQKGITTVYHFVTFNGLTCVDMEHETWFNCYFFLLDLNWKIALARRFKSVQIHCTFIKFSSFFFWIFKRDSFIASVIVINCFLLWKKLTLRQSKLWTIWKKKEKTQISWCFEKNINQCHIHEHRKLLNCSKSFFSSLKMMTTMVILLKSANSTIPRAIKSNLATMRNILMK